MTVHTSKLGQADQPPNRHGIIPCRTSLFFKNTRKSWGRFTHRQGNCIVKQISNVILPSKRGTWTGNLQKMRSMMKREFLRYTIYNTIQSRRKTTEILSNKQMLLSEEMQPLPKSTYLQFVLHVSPTSSQISYKKVGNCSLIQKQKNNPIPYF